MKKILLLVAIATMSVFTVNAQSKVKYQGEVDLGYSIRVGEIGAGRLNLHTIQGVKIGEYFSTGVGVGLDYYVNLYEGDGNSDLMMPIFLNIKGYMPVSEQTSLYASMDMGVGVGLTSGVSGMSGALFTPAIGVKVGDWRVQLGYNIQKISESGLSINMKALQLKVGITF